MSRCLLPLGVLFGLLCSWPAYQQQSVASNVVQSEKPQTKPWVGLSLGDKIAVVCDHTLIEQAQAIRATLEAYRLRVDYFRLNQYWQADDFFNKQAKAYDYVVICSHGTKEPTVRIKLEVIQPKKDNPELGDIVDYELTPENIPTRLLGFQGVVVSLACESGRKELAQAFLKAGCKAYLGPAEYSDDSSGLIYVQAFFYFLQYQWRLPAPEKWSIKDAAEAAQRLDPRAKFGTKIWQCYER